MPAPIEPAETFINLPQKPINKVAFQAPKPGTLGSAIISSGTAKPDQKPPSLIKALATHQEDSKEITSTRLFSGNNLTQVRSHVRQKFPVVWFIILSAILAALLIAYAASNKEYPPVEGVFLLLMIPFAIPWLLIVAKALAPGYGFLLFLAMAHAIILLILFVNWLIDVQEKARRKRYQREREKEQLERDQVP